MPAGSWSEVGSLLNKPALGVLLSSRQAALLFLLETTLRGGKLFWELEPGILAAAE